MKRRADCIFAAGLFEGEGTVYIAPATMKSSTHLGHLTIAVSSTDRKTIEFLVNRWPGYFGHVPPRTESHREYWRWQLIANKAASFLKDIRPYLVSDRNRARADLGIAYQDQKERRNRPTQEYRDRQQQYHLQMKNLTNTR